mmetsp:Transcript_62125/g.136029  ORF Transcript_62125/g.136029 Transcript_62125/m.136029 type:complete len:236 (+) Transcript_62125:471-1178(+)
MFQSLMYLRLLRCHRIHALLWLAASRLTLLQHCHDFIQAFAVLPMLRARHVHHHLCLHSDLLGCHRDLKLGGGEPANPLRLEHPRHQILHGALGSLNAWDLKGTVDDRAGSKELGAAHHGLLTILALAFALALALAFLASFSGLLGFLLWHIVHRFCLRQLGLLFIAGFISLAHRLPTLWHSFADLAKSRLSLKLLLQFFSHSGTMFQAPQGVGTWGGLSLGSLGLHRGCGRRSR